MSIILSIYSYTKGYGYALFNGETLLDAGNIAVVPVCNIKLFEKMNKYYMVARPDVMVLRSDAQRVSERTVELLSQLKRCAQDMNTPVVEVRRGDMKDAFTSYGCGSNKHEIALKICEWFPILEEYLPPKRKAWDAQHPKMGVFDAVAMVFVYFHQQHAYES